MSSKHKKKKRLSSKEEARLRGECKKHFFERVEKIFSFAGGEAEYIMLPRQQLERIYIKRILPFKIIAAPGETIPPEVIKEIKNYFYVITQNEEYSITEKGNSFSLFEWFTIGLTVIIYLELLEGDEFNNAGKVKELLKKFKPQEAIYTGAIERMSLIISVTGFMVSDLTSKLYWLEQKYEPRHTRTIGIENIILVHSYSPEKISIAIEGDKYRPAIKVCFALSADIQNIKVKRSLLGLKDSAADSEIDIYIQMHAMQRMKERLDCLDIVGINLGIFFSLKKLKIIKTGENDYMIEFRMDSILIGYLVAHIQDEKLIIRTFLFVTQARTPEGKRLKELYGLGRLDVSYLELDKLSTYIYNDLCTNPGVSNIFQEAGCQYLLDLYTDSRIRSFCHNDKNYSRMDLMIKYLGIDNKME
jgi:hypothetical protein